MFLYLSASLYSQNKDIGLKIGTYGIYIPPTKTFSKFVSGSNIYTTIEIGASYNIKKKLEIEVNFSYWSSILEDKFKESDMSIADFKAFDTLSTLPFGRVRYKYLDIVLNRELINYRNNRIFITLGGSFARGKNGYLTKVVWSPDPNFIDLIHTDYKYLYENYFGVVSGLSYSYSLFKDRLRLGINSNIRYYQKYPLQLNYGVTIKGKI